jgi:GNAT superfamily N-acetyltransferase
MNLLWRIPKVWHNWRSLPGDAVLAWRSDGPAQAWRTIIERSGYLIFHRDRLLVLAQRLDAFQEVAAPAGVRLGLVDESELAGFAGLVGPWDLERFRRRLAAGCLCLGAWRDGQPVGYTWYSDRLGPEVTACPLPLPPDAAYLYDLYVAPAERGSGIGSALVAARLRLARETGHREGWRMISWRNAASLRTAEKTAGHGARIVGEMRYVKLLSWMRARFVPVAADERAT